MRPKLYRQYRQRLRSRIIVSFLVLGTGLTALFAVATLLLREQMENRVIGEGLLDNVRDYARAFYEDPKDPRVAYERFEGVVFSKRKFPNVPIEWRDLPNGVHDVAEVGPDGVRRLYKIAVQKDPEFWFFLRYDTTQERLSQERMQRNLLFTLIAFSLLAYVLGWWSSRRVMQPVADLAARLGSLRNGGAPEPLAPHFADDEVGQLAATLDDFAERLTALVRRDREFNADVSHELRTPLAVIRGATELLLAQTDLSDKTRLRLQRIERAVQQCADLIDALLTLSRGERGYGRAEVRKVAEQIAESQRLGLKGKAITIDVSGAEDAVLDVPEAALSVALNNLVGNAVKYTPHGHVEVEVFADRVEVRDNGPGINAEDAARVFERGYRGKSAEGSKGAGIGLAIVTRLCDLYGWQVALAPREPGGAVATLAFRSAVS